MLGTVKPLDFDLGSSDHYLAHICRRINTDICKHENYSVCQICRKKVLGLADRTENTIGVADCQVYLDLAKAGLTKLSNLYLVPSGFFMHDYYFSQSKDFLSEKIDNANLSDKGSVLDAALGSVSVYVSQTWDMYGHERAIEAYIEMFNQWWFYANK